MLPGLTRRRSWLASVLFLTSLSFAREATAQGAAQGKEACFEAHQAGQDLRDANQLIAAKASFRRCAQICESLGADYKEPAKDCTTWLAEVDHLIPTVVLVARDVTGRDYLDVKVTMDGKELVSKLDGNPVAIETGVHVFVFTSADGLSQEETVVIRAGEKARRIEMRFSAKVEPRQDAPAVLPPPAPPAEPAESSSSTQRTVGYLVGGLGVAGIVTGAIAGIVAIDKKSSAKCDEQHKVCDEEALRSARSAATVSTFTLVGGSLLVAAGVVIVLIAPSPKRASLPRIEAAPVLARDESGFMVRGRW